MEVHVSSTSVDLTPETYETGVGPDRTGFSGADRNEGLRVELCGLDLSSPHQRLGTPRPEIRTRGRRTSTSGPAHVGPTRLPRTPWDPGSTTEPPLSRPRAVPDPGSSEKGGGVG